MTIIPLSIQSFIPSVGLTNQGKPCFTLGKFLIIGDNITRFDVDTGVEEKTAAFTSSVNVMGLDDKGNTLATDIIQAFIGFRLWNLDCELVDSWGAGSTGWTLGSNLPYPFRGLVPQSIGDGTFLLSSTYLAHTIPLGGPTAQTICGQAIAPGFGGLGGVIGTVDNPDPFACAGVQLSDTEGQFVVIGGPHSGSDPQELVLFTGTLLAEGNSWVTQPLVQVGVAIPANDIDPTWSHCAHGGAVLDKTDGNLIVPVGTSDLVAQVGYVVKLNVTTGEMMWKVPVPSVSLVFDIIAYGRVEGGIYGYWSSPGVFGTITLINTLDGTYTVYDVGFPAGILASEQCWDSRQRRFIMRGDFTKVEGGPTLRGDTPSSFIGGYFALYMGQLSQSYVEII